MTFEYHSIEIDCSPGTARPDTHFKNLLGEIDMREDEFELVGKSFGNWTWRVKSESVTRYEAKRSVVSKLLKKLYDEGVVRYAGW